ncbi:aspartyl-phosphate phosphatase Spo0E family protein [Paenibacillus albiflavus]|uniref:Aspartyl-phosphate phosphatase Spo0E family protein n=1 Tax=Paenibacillus albiflavus TaxID=2545760 RepID=A0A4R4E8T8_9BACL|nr:aspartyl-phosphate phosphatase Spo0E family protein [Paenibacillus albiflavus]TCZ75393.1 aspartyl-phosphate phosphatase Spo0E family protein [Paenibacillus albiflavus]
MTSKLNKITGQIEVLRKELNEIVQNKELTDSEVIAASEKLDEALNEYDRLLKKQSRQS